MAKIDWMKKIDIKEVKQHLKEEKAKLGIGVVSASYEVGSKEYDEVLDRISLLLEIIRRKQGEKAYKRELKRLI